MFGLYVIIYVIFTSFGICKTFKAFKITFLKNETIPIIEWHTRCFSWASETCILVMKQNFDFSCLKYLLHQVNNLQIMKFLKYLISTE